MATHLQASTTSILCHRGRGSSYSVTTQSPSEGGKDWKPETRQSLPRLDRRSCLPSVEGFHEPSGQQQQPLRAMRWPMTVAPTPSLVRRWRGYGDVRMVDDRTVVGPYPTIAMVFGSVADSWGTVTWSWHGSLCYRRWQLFGNYECARSGCQRSPRSPCAPGPLGSSRCPCCPLPGHINESADRIRQ